MALNRIADGALFVIRYDYVTLQTIKSSLNALEESGTNVLGAVVNKVNLRYFAELTRYSRYSGSIEPPAKKGAKGAKDAKPKRKAPVFKRGASAKHAK